MTFYQLQRHHFQPSLAAATAPSIAGVISILAAATAP